MIEQPNWVEQLEFSPLLTIFAKTAKKDAVAANQSNYVLNTRILIDFLKNIKDLDPLEFKVLYFCKDIRKRSLSVDASKTLPLFDKSEYKYGCIIFDKHLSVIYGFSNSNLAINIVLMDGLVYNVEICAYESNIKKSKTWQRSSSIATGLNLLKLANKSVELLAVNDALHEAGWDDKVSYFNDTIPLLAIYYFAEIEDKYVQHGKIPRAHIGDEKFLNETNVPIQVVGCNWFTNIIRTEGFGVKGHFRNQAHGVGLTKHKLIWVKDFEKKGYKRKAQKAI